MVIVGSLPAMALVFPRAIVAGHLGARAADGRHGRRQAVDRVQPSRRWPCARCAKSVAVSLAVRRTRGSRFGGLATGMATPRRR